MFGSIFNCNCPIRYNVRLITLLITYSCSNKSWFNFLLEYVFREMPSICTSGSEATFVLTVIRRSLQDMHL